MIINPDLSVHEIYYLNKNCYIPDYKRKFFTRFRTSSHNLYVEKGRWSRIKSEERLCRCKQNKIENEYHVVFECEITKDLRQKYEIRNYTNLAVLFKSHPMTSLVDFIYEVMKKFD